MNQGNRHNIATNKSRIVFFSWASSWAKMRQCLDGAITQAKGRLNVFEKKQFDEIKIRIDSENNKTNFPDKFGEFYNKYKKGGYPALKAIIVFGDVPNESLVSKCKDNMMGFINENIPIIACICGRQDLAIDGYFHCWCPSINIVARTAAQQSDEVHKRIAKHDHSTFWCLFTNDLAGFGNESAETYKSWLTDAYGFEEGRIKCICINNISDFRPKENDIAFITGFGSDYSKLVKEALKYKTKYKNLFLIFDQSIADPENISGKKEEGKLLESSSVQYIDFMPTGATKQLALKNKFAVLPYVAFSLADRISAKENAREALRELPFIDVDGETYLISESSTIAVPVSLMDAEISNESGFLYESTIQVKNRPGGDFLPSEKLGFLLQGVAKQMLNLSVHSPAKEIETTVSRIEGVFIEALSNCRIAIDVPVIYDGTKSYCSKQKNVADIFRGIRAIGGIYQFKDLIQMSVIADDVAEDNGIARAYFKYANVNSPTPLRFLDDKKANIEQLVFSRNLDYEVKRGSYAFIKSLDDKQRNELVKVVQALKHFSEECNANYVYIIPYPVTESCGGALLIASPCKFTYLNGRIINAISEQIFSSIAGVLKSQALECANVKSAIGSIMSRNGSHNIGSHVLAALSHNVGTMPDDRVLYQYIQHRMDYIATATTDFPVWKQPLYLVGNLIKTFLMQRHLLDHITGSEGLRAYQFQNDRIDTTKKESQPNTICIHARRINDADSEWGEANNFSIKQDAINFIGYPDSPCSPGAMKHDLELAIPGGIVGQHAFFTILENILRNAAKHEWAKLKNVQNDENAVSGGESPKDKSSDGQPDNESSAGEKEPCHHLDIHIDFKDNPDSGLVEFVVWTDSEFSRHNYPIKTFKNRAGRLPCEDILARLSRDESTEELDTKGLEEHQKLQLMMARSLINKEGQLRKENWGLAEMRISAGFLNVADVATIGGFGDRTATMDLISPTMVLCKDHYCMGYHFHVPKPRELLIVVPDDLLKKKKNAIKKIDLESAHAKLMKYGIGIVTEDEVGKESEKPERSDRLSYAYALFNKFNHDCMRTWKIPFRLVTIANDPLSPPLSPKKDKGQKLIDRRADFTGNADFFAPNSFSAWLRDVLKSDDKAKEHAEKILSEIYASWVRHLKKEYFGVGNGLKNIPIAIDLDGDNKNAEGSLISDMELLELVLGDCFNSAVDSYLTSPLSEEADDSLKHTLKLLKTLHPRIIELQRLKTKTLIDTEKNKEIKVARDVDGVIRAQLLTWCIGLKEDANVRKIASDLYYIEEGRNQTCTPGLKGFMLFLTNTILNQVKALMTRYEERFVPLPRDILPPKHQTSQRSENRDPNSQHGGKGYLEPLIDLGNQQVFETVSDEVKCNFLEEHMNASNDTAEILAFWRHEVSASPRTIERGKKEIKLLYREPLSGSQSYLNSFETFYDGSSTEIQRKRFVAKLLETGLTKVLLIDERVKKFENEHSNVKATFADIGISTLDNECCETKELFNFAQQKRHPIDVKIDDQLISEFDIVVIHQGVIDKLLADHNNPDKIRKFIEYLKSEIRYVVVTTGRGNPANIPNDVRVLPFSVIESTLFKKYPEKLILIDAIMNLLPSGGKE